MDFREHALNLIDEEEVVRVTRDLVAIPSVSPAEGRGMVDYMERWFRDLDIPYTEYPVGDGCAHFLSHFGSVSGPGRFVFNGHQDTKPVENMTVDPFAGEIGDGKLYGRGACDMKGGIASLLCAFKALVRCGFRPKGGITFYSDIREEYGGPYAMDYILNQGILDGYEGLISCEPSNLDVQIGDKGGISACFEIRGRSAHSGIAHLGVNAIHHMAGFILEYLELPYLTKENRYFGKPTINFEMIRGGLYLSAVPDRCVACIDTRLIPETPPEEVQKEIRELMDRMGRSYGMDIRKIDPPSWWSPVFEDIPSYFIAPDHELARRACRALHAATGREAVISGCPGATIAGKMISRGVPAVICGPGSLAQAHTDDEYVPVTALHDAARIYTALMAEM